MQTVRTTFLVAIIAIIAVSIGGYYFYFVALTDSTTSYDTMSSAVEAFQDGDLAYAIEAAHKVRDAGPSDPLYFSALRLLSNATFDVGGNAPVSQQLEAVRFAKEYFVAAAHSPYDQALSLNMLLQFATQAQGNEVINEVFRDEPFASAVSPTSTALSIRNLAKRSLSLAPTSRAYFALARYETERILPAMKPASSELAHPSTALSEDLRRRAERVGVYIGKADALQDAERKYYAYSPFGIMAEPNFFFSRGLALSIAARVNPVYIPEAERSFTEVFEYDERLTAEHGSPFPVLEPIVARAHLAYARMLYAVVGVERAGDVDVHLTTLTTMLQRDTDGNLASLRLFFVTAVNEEGHEYAVEEYTRLSAVSPAFRSYLVALGWNL
jgi:hypothetical protein